MLDNITTSNLDSSSKKKQDYAINIINDLKKIKEEGNSLYKNNKIEEATNIFLKGYNLFQKEINDINNDIPEDITNDLFKIYKKILSKLSKCYFKKEKYNDAITYDLKIIELEPKFYKSLARLFYSYSKLNKCQQAIFYGEIILDLNVDMKNKFVDIKKNVKEEKMKLSKIQQKSFIKNIIIFLGSVSIVFLAVFSSFYIKNNYY